MAKTVTGSIYMHRRAINMAPLLGSNHAEVVPDSYIVILKDNTKSGQSLLQGHLAWLTSTIREANARAPPLKDANQIRHIYDEGIFGYSGKFEPEILERIRRSEVVAFVEKDATVHVPEAPPDSMHTVPNKAQK
ncbi:proteinase B [Coemansia spiralis]|uniref:Proteinase B n=1 Tax=Coemansia spiralis TaxID=417178 RepID=A0A9W8GGC0_9FUNG|nr:proteinase B [Coemansia spiralis]